MPELPEVETIRRQLVEPLTGSTIVDAWSFGTEKFEQAPLAVGHRITGIHRRGKYLLLGLETTNRGRGASGPVSRTIGRRNTRRPTPQEAGSTNTPGDPDHKELIVHLGMTGRLSLSEPGRGFGTGSRPPHRRAEWLLDDGRILEFTDVRRFGRIAVVVSGDHASLPTLDHMGPEPFDEALTSGWLRDALSGSRQAIKTQLMSQRVIAGLGNIYVDESLWLARIHPESRRITLREADRLLDAIRSSLESGIANGGTTLRDYRDATGGSGTNQTTLQCYGRSGLPCTRCGRELERVTLAGRTTTFCSRCQRRRL